VPPEFSTTICCNTFKPNDLLFKKFTTHKRSRPTVLNTFLIYIYISSNPSDRDYLCALGDFNLPDIPWSGYSYSHEFVTCILDLSLYYINYIRNRNNHLLDLIFVSDPSVCAVDRIDPLMLPEDSFHRTLETILNLPVLELSVLPKSAFEPRCFRKTDFNNAFLESTH